MKLSKHNYELSQALAIRVCQNISELVYEGLTLCSNTVETDPGIYSTKKKKFVQDYDFLSKTVDYSTHFFGKN